MAKRAPAPRKSPEKGFKAHSLRLNLEAHKQLKHLAVDLDCSLHDLLLEGVNEVFRKNRKRPIA